MVVYMTRKLLNDGIQILMKYYQNMIGKINYDKPKISRVDSDYVMIIKELNSVGIKPEDMTEVLDISLNRIKYELKQLENREV
jgi:hypothetical protein